MEFEGKVTPPRSRHHSTRAGSGGNFAASGCFYPIPQALVRQITIYKLKYPGEFVLLRLFDANGAFTNLETNEADVCQFATEMPFTSEQPPDVEKLTGTLAIFLSLNSLSSRRPTQSRSSSN